MNRAENEAYLSGVLVALGEVIKVGEDTLAETIIKLVGPYALLRIAKKNEDIFLPQLRRRIRYLRSQRK